MSKNNKLEILRSEINKLKSIIIDYINFSHEILVEISDESEEWYHNFKRNIEIYKKTLRRM